MLIELADDLATGLSAEDIACIELILHARRHGHHRLVGSEYLFRSLRKMGFSQRESVVLDRVRDQQIQKLSLRQSVTCRLRISHEVGPSRVATRDGTVINLRVSDLGDFYAFAPTVILGENAKDARLAEVMARVYATSKRMCTPLSCMHFGGGGDTTADAFRSWRDEPRLCICLVDSDRDFPGDPLGPTARKVFDERDYAKKPWAVALATCCRAAENQLPSRLVERAVDDDPQLLDRVPDLEKISRIGKAGELRDFCNLKRGTSLQWVLAMPLGARRDYWLKRIAGIATPSGGERDCAERQACCYPEGCECWIVRGFGDRLLDSCLDAMETMSTHKLAESLCSVTRPHWLHIGAAVFSWTCGAPRLFV